MIPYGKQDITDQDIEAVVEVLKSDFLTQGPKVPEFEKTICDYTVAKYAFALNSATSALHVACKALDLKAGDYLWTSPITFVASANCALYCGAKVDFVDIDPITYNLCPDQLEAKLKQAKQENKLPKVVVPVHLCGQSCDMERIQSLSHEFGFKIIEDASHAIGGKYQGQPIGGNQYADMTIFSFHPVKIVTTAEGGVVTTNDAELAKRINLFRSHGVTRDPALMTSSGDEAWYYEQVELGFNYRMTEMQAALGMSQFKRLDDFVSKRNELAQRYHEKLAELPVQLPQVKPSCYSAYHLYAIRLDLDKINVNRKQVFDALRAEGIGVNVHYIPVHTQPYYQGLGFKRGGYPKSEYYYEGAISLPLYPGMTNEDQDCVITALQKALNVS